MSDYVFFQHTPVILHVCNSGRINVHNLVPDLLKCCTLQLLGKKIGNHLFRWAVFNRDLARLDPISDKKVSNIDVCCTLTA
jgi:hypothetical protein